MQEADAKRVSWQFTWNQMLSQHRLGGSAKFDY